MFNFMHVGSQNGFGGTTYLHRESFHDPSGQGNWGWGRGEELDALNTADLCRTLTYPLS